MLPGFDGLRFSHWQADLREDGVVVLSLDRQGAPVNAFSQEVLLELGAVVERLALDPPKVWCCARASPTASSPVPI